MSEKHLIVGLGNPGPRYANTRHNVGFKVVERLAERLQLSFRPGKGDYLLASGATILLMKPLTFMNNSGLAVRHAADDFGLECSRILIVLDDHQLPLGKLRLRTSGSDGGHNGLASVIQHLGTQEIPRLRLGIGAEFAKGEMADYVLSAFSKEEQKRLPEIYDRAVEAALSFINDGVQQAMNKFNT
ncbi:MAG: aminoacyl-tRNA hydrolase [candidate division KSB1 bacterium]|nr:aminoacyl-tRNA hydrolase [candidate division KSB1 bacterium]MDZ7365272.1 aminoacyl-tRNA hydrolase [candidate division KSB1 bacterium]MDZ7403139.1 aminoacyl-tRNA hydrolase [candidate division KSB1 bacterium]